MSPHCILILPSDVRKSDHSCLPLPTFILLPQVIPLVHVDDGGFEIFVAFNRHALAEFFRVAFYCVARLVEVECNLASLSLATFVNAVVHAGNFAEVFHDTCRFTAKKRVVVYDPARGAVIGLTTCWWTRIVEAFEDMQTIVSWMPFVELMSLSWDCRGKLSRKRVG